MPGKDNAPIHIVLAWELGGGYGHIMGFLPLIEALLAQDVKVSMIAKNVMTAHRILQHLPVKIYQAPIFTSLPKPAGTPKLATLSYGDILHTVAYSDRESLLGLVNAWGELYTCLAPDLIVADHSPTALVAARCHNIRMMSFGTGFFIPPDKGLLPLFQSVPKTEEQACRQREQLVLRNINAVLAHYHQPVLAYVSDIFKGALNCLSTLPELDHYSQRDVKTTRYWGPRYAISQGVKIGFKTTNKPRIFAYIKENVIGVKQLIEGIVATGYECIMHIPNPSESLNKYVKAHPQLTLSAEPVCIEHLLAQADLLISHGGHGLVAAGLLAGKRQLLVPSQLEQSLLTQRLTQAKLVMALPTTHVEHTAQAIHAALNNDILGIEIENFSKKYADLSLDEMMTNMAQESIEFAAS